MKKRILSFILVAAMLFCVVPLCKFSEAYAMSNASALTPVVYKTGSYTTLTSLNLYSDSSASKSTGTKVAKNTKVSVTSVSGNYGKVTVNNKTGWIDLSYAYNMENTVDIQARLNMLREKFPDGMYWNRESASVNNADGYTDKPCEPGHTDKRDNTFDGTVQCHGFALKLGYDLFGIHASYWERHYDLDKVVVGDLIRYRNRHTVMVTGVYDDGFTVADCNYYYTCNISWDRWMSKSLFSFIESNQYDGVYHCQINTNSNQTQVLTTSLPSDSEFYAILIASDEVGYIAEGTISGGKTTFSFNAPTGTYELRIVDDWYNSVYIDKSFVLGTDKLPEKIYVGSTGDVNGDGAINGKDSTLLMQYLAEWDVDIDKAAADVNGDGEVNGKDSTLLMQYLAEWDVTLG